MNQRLVTVLIFAMVIAGLTSFGLYRAILSHGQAPAQQPVVTTRVVAATHDLQVGALLKEADVHEVQISGSVPVTALHSVAEAVGRGVVSPIYLDEPVLSTRLANKGAGAGLAAMIPVGMRALALPVNEVVGLAGFVSPGMRVDVLVSGSGSIQGSQSGTMCRTILQNIEVLSAGQKVERNIEGKPESAQVVNLLVTPSDAEILDLASGQTKVQLVLRNPLDTTNSNTTGISLAKLLGQTEMPAAAPAPVSFAPAPRVMAAAAASPAPELDTIEVFNGKKHSEQQFDRGAK